MKKLLLTASSKLGIDLTSHDLEQFLLYKNFLLEWNKKVNLTAICDERDVIIKHFIDSLSALHVVDFKQDSRIIDIGTGAGFPGVPIKIIRPDLRLSLVDSLNKRITFLKELTSLLSLNDVQSLHMRAEDCGRDKEFRELYDYCVSRAVAPLNVLCEYAVPLLKIGGSFISYKGPDISVELAQANCAINKLGCELLAVNSFTLPESCINRTIIVIKKLRQTSPLYPRKQNLIKKNPII